MTKNLDITQNCAIGVIDSGVGGITVLRELIKKLPNEKFIYIGDEANFPYGEKSTEQLKSFAINLCEKLKQKNIKLLVIACGTMTANAFDVIKNYVDVPVVGVVQPAVDDAIACTNNNNIGVLATKATINSNIFEKSIQEKIKNANVISVAAPKFVEFVQNSIQMVENSPSQDLMYYVEKYTKSIKENQCDTVILACTHFPPLQPVLEKELGSCVQFITPGKSTANAAYKILDNSNMLSQGIGSVVFYTTSKSTDNLKNFWGKEGEFHTLCV